MPKTDEYLIQRVSQKSMFYDKGEVGQKYQKIEDVFYEYLHFAS